MTRVVEDDRRRWTTTERTRRAPVLQLRRNRQGKVRRSTPSISREQRARAALHHEGRSAQASRWHHWVRVGGWVHILRARGSGQRLTSRLCVLKESEALSDSGVGGVELGRASVGVNSIRDLIVAALVETAQVEPDLRDVRVDAYSAGVCVKRIAVLVDLEVKDANRTPKSGIPTIPVHGLLVGLVRLVVLLTSHIRPAKQVPALCVTRFCGIVSVHWIRSGTFDQLTGLKALRQVLDSKLLVLERGAVLVVQPPQLLENLGVIRVLLHDALVGVSRAHMLGSIESDNAYSIYNNTKRTSRYCSNTCPIWNQMSAWASGLGGLRRMRSKHSRLSAYLPCCL